LKNTKLADDYLTLQGTGSKAQELMAQVEGKVRAMVDIGLKHGLNFDDPTEAQRMIEQEFLQEACKTVNMQVEQTRESQVSMVKRYRLRQDANAKRIQAMISLLEEKNKELR
jgi:uncharacterized protein related to proFAR isomerase